MTPFRKPFWIIPLLIAALVAVFGGWGNARLRTTIETQLRAELTATLDANVTALEIWTTNQTKLVIALADDPKVRALASRIFEESGTSRDNDAKPPLSDIEEFDTYLRSRLRALGYGIARLVSTNFVYVATSGRGRLQPRSPVYDEHVAKFSELFTSGQPVIITPFKPRRPPMFGPPPRLRRPSDPEFRGPADPSGAPREGRDRDAAGASAFGPRDFSRFRPGDRTLMQVAAPIHDDPGALRGALAVE